MRTVRLPLPGFRPARPRQVYYGWWIVAAWVVLNIYWAGTLNYGLTVFFTPVRHSFGWDAALLAFIFSLGNILNGLLSPLTGAWFDHAGPRPLMLVASLCSGIGLLALSHTASLPSFLAAFGLVSVGYGIWSGTGLATVGLWFSRRRGLAMGIVMAGSALGGLLVPGWQRLITTAGWRGSFLLAGVLMLLIGGGAALVLQHRPEDRGLLPDGSPIPPRLTGDAAQPSPLRAAPAPDGDSGFWSALRTHQFWVISAVTSVILAGSTAATVLLLPRLQDAHVSTGRAVTAATLALLLGAVGRPGNGFLADRVRLPVLITLLFGCQAVGLAAFAGAPNQLAFLVLFVLGFGLSNDVIRLVASMLLLRYYGSRTYGRILGAHFLVLIPGRVLGPVLAGAFHDRGYGYGSAFWLYALLTVIMVLPMLYLRAPLPRLAAGRQSDGVCSADGEQAVLP